MSDTEIRLSKLEEHSAHIRRVIDAILKNANFKPETLHYLLGILSDGFKCEESRVADIEKHIHDDCDCVHCEKLDNYMEASQKLEPDAYKLERHPDEKLCAEYGPPDFETHPRGTVEGLRAELERAITLLKDAGLELDAMGSFIQSTTRSYKFNKSNDIVYRMSKAIRGKHQ